MELGERSGVGHPPRGLNPWRIRRSGEVALHVLGQGQHNRARTIGQRNLKGLRHHRGNVVGALNLLCPFGKWRKHRLEIDLLKGLTPEVTAFHLPQQQNHRRRILKRRVHPNRCLRRAWPARRQTDPGTTRQLAPRLGHMRRRRLVARGHKMDRVAMLPEPIKNR